jgi:transcriptional regulator with XRE-family HTH domain
MTTQRGKVALHPTMWEQPAMRAALARRDIGAVYRRLTDAGFSQREIARLTGQSQSEVSEILAGRQVIAYPVLTRIAEGLGIARGCMGLATAPDHAAAPPGVERADEGMKKDALLAAASEVLFGRAVLGAAMELPSQPEPPTPLPSRLAARDVEGVRAMTQQLETLAKAYGGSAEMLSPVASGAERLMSVPGSKDIARELAIAIAELHTVAGWAAFDAHRDSTSSYHFARAMELSADSADAGVAFSKAAYLSGVATAERGHHNDGLKLLQLGKISIDSVPATPRTRELTSWLAADSACVLARMNQDGAARRALAMASDTWCAPGADDQADMAWVTALAELALGQLEAAHRLVASAVRHWEGTADRRQAVLGAITLAIIHVRAGEPDAHELAHRAITEVAELRSSRARERLAPLIAELKSHSSVSAWQLAGLASRVASGT